MCKQAEEHTLGTMSDVERPDTDMGAGHQMEKMPLLSGDASPSQNTCKTSSAGQDTYIGAFESADMRGEPRCSHATVLPVHHNGACSFNSSIIDCQTASLCLSSTFPQRIPQP